MTSILFTGSLYYFKQCTIALALNCSVINIIKTYFSCFSYYNYCFKSCKLCSNSRYCCFTFFSIYCYRFKINNVSVFLINMMSSRHNNISSLSSCSFF